MRSRYFEYQTPDGKWQLDNAYDLGRISRQQDFLRRLFETAQAKGVFNASVAKGLIDTLTKYVVVDQSLTIDDMLQFLGVLQQVQADGVPTYQIAAKRQIVQNNDVLQAQVDTPEMQQILDMFRGKTSLAAAAPERRRPAATGRTNGPRAPRRRPRRRAPRRCAPARRSVDPPMGPRRPTRRRTPRASSRRPT